MLFRRRFAFTGNGDGVPQYGEIDPLGVDSGNEGMNMHLPFILAQVDEGKPPRGCRSKKRRGKGASHAEAAERLVDLFPQTVQLPDYIPVCHVKYLLSIVLVIAGQAIET
jgi:hypothetical protein